MIIIAGIIDVPIETRDAVVAESAALQKATRDDEPGCLAYCFAADPVVPGRIQVYELWTDAASLEAHFQHPNYHNMRALLGASGILAADNWKYRIDAKDPVYGADRVASARFWSVGE
ncbi:MAG: putative quinol monooxygenase [Acidimicrobiales bacterium]